jgi:ribosomal protein S18 acetylase RimI-like enzyme
MPVLEPIRPKNAHLLKAVRLQALKDSPLAFGSTYAKESQFTDADWLKRAVDWNSDRSVGYLALDGEKPCGIAGAFLDEKDPTIAHLVSMWVSPRHRRSGIGRALVGTIQAWAEDRNAHFLRLDVTNTNLAAIKFYQQIGFRPTGNTSPYPNDPALFEYEMAQAIGPAAEG